MSIVRWEDPPPADRARALNGRGQTPWRAIVAELAANRGRWALVSVCRSQSTAGSTALMIRRSMMPSFHGRQFEAVARRVDGEFRVYARYVGEAGQHG